MESLVQEKGLLNEWSNPTDQESQLEILLSCISQQWKAPSEIKSDYTEKSQEPVHNQTLSSYLLELEALGEVEAKGCGPSRQYRKADKPVKETQQASVSRELESFTEKVRDIVEQEIEKALNSEEFEQLIQQKQNKKLRQALITSSSFEAFQDQMQLTNPAVSNNSRDLHKKYVWNSVKQFNGEWVSTSDIYQKYKEKTQDPLSERSCRRKLKELHEEGLIQQKGATRSTKYKSL